MNLKQKYLRGTIRQVANELNITYAAARNQLIKGSIKAKKIAIDYEEQILIKEHEEQELLRKKEENIQNLKKNLGRTAV